MSKSDTPPNIRERRPRLRGSGRWLLLIGTGALVVGLVWFSWAFRQAGDHAPDGPVVQNDSNQIILIYTVEPKGNEVLRFSVSPGIDRTLSGNCMDELVARDEAGNLLARRGPFDVCNLETWVIEPIP